jgi:hypothetical protein
MTVFESVVCSLQPGTKPSPKTTVPSVQMLALNLHFGVHDEVKMLPSFLKCFPNVETLCIQVNLTSFSFGIFIVITYSFSTL